MTRAKLICCVVMASGWLTLESVVADTNSLPDLRNLDKGAGIGPKIQSGGNGSYYHPWRQTAWES